MLDGHWGSGTMRDLLKRAIAAVVIGVALSGGSVVHASAAPPPDETSTTDGSITIHGDYEIVSTRVVDRYNPQAGTVQPAVETVLRPRSTGPGTQSSLSCIVTAHAFTPTYSGGPTPKANGFADVEVDSDCASAVSWTHRLQQKRASGSYSTIDTVNLSTNPGQFSGDNRFRACVNAVTSTFRNVNTLVATQPSASLPCKVIS